MLDEAAGYPTPGGARRRLLLAAAGLVLLLLLIWFLSRHLTFTSGATPAATAPRHTTPAAGYPRTEAGAVDAATFYLVTLNGPLVLQPDRLAEFEKGAGSGAYAEQLVRDSQDGAANLESTFGLRAAQQRGLAAALQPQPLAYKLTSEWNGWSVSVAVWWIELVAIDGVTSTLALWQTTTLSLVWENEAWHISQASTVAGPGPNGDNQQLPEQLRSFQRYRNVV